MKYQTATFILYLWDSVSNIEGINSILNYFDKVFSFDRDDVQNYKFIYRPTFYRPEIQNIHGYREYDISFLGSAHSDRISYLININQVCTKQGYNVYFKVLIGKFDCLLQG